MLYLAIDQHRKQLTVNLRNEQGDVLVKRQVSTEWPRVRSFLDEVREMSVSEGGFIAILEVCGFNDWLLKLLAEYGCRETILIQPEKRSKKKTDRRDAYALGELLWVNRQRLLAGKKVQGIRRIQLPTDREAEDRQLTAVRQRMGRQRTRTINKIKHLLRKHNLEQQQPAKGLDTQRTRKWLATLPLEPIDRLEKDLLLAQWKLWDDQLARLELEIEKRQAKNAMAAVLATIPGWSNTSNAWVTTPPFGILFRGSGQIQVFSNGSDITGSPTTPTTLGGTASTSQMHHFDIVCTDPSDSNPFDGSGTTTIKVYQDGYQIDTTNLAGSLFTHSSAPPAPR